MTWYMLIRGIVIGLIFGIPIGAIGALTIQRTLSFGFFAGILSGLGSSIADTFYASICIFGITIISDFLLDNQLIISIFGGLILFFIGIKLITRKNVKENNIRLKKANILKILFSSFAVGFTNPIAIFSFLFAFSYFEIVDKINLKSGIFLVLGVFIGTFIWWIILASSTNLLKNKIKANSIVILNRGFGIIIIVFSFVIFIKIFIN